MPKMLVLLGDEVPCNGKGKCFRNGGFFYIFADPGGKINPDDLGIPPAILTHNLVIIRDLKDENVEIAITSRRRMLEEEEARREGLRREEKAEEARRAQEAACRGEDEE